jgi:hypothetical protein
MVGCRHSNTGIGILSNVYKKTIVLGVKMLYTVSNGFQTHEQLPVSSGNISSALLNFPKYQAMFPGILEYCS